MQNISNKQNEGDEQLGMKSPEATQAAFVNVTVPGDDSCLFWAVTFAYLVPVKYDSTAFKERFETVFENEGYSQMIEIQELFQLHSRPLNTAAIASNKTLNRLVTTNLRHRVVTEMLDFQKEFEHYITLYDILQSNNRAYIIEGKFEERFRTQFKEEIEQNLINVDSSTLRTFDSSAVKVILSELDKVDKRKVKSFEFKTYLECMRYHKACGGLHEIKALSRLLHCNIHVSSENQQYLIECDKSRGQIHLLHRDQVHYEFFLVTAEALIEVIRKDKKEVAQNYLNIGIDNVNYKDDGGWTPLHFAAQLNSVEIIQSLLSQGADIHAENRIHQTPLDVAQFFEKKNASKFLREQMSQTGSSAQSKIQEHPGNMGTNETTKVLCSQIQENTAETDVNEVNSRLEEFVEYFVKEFESKLYAYHMIIEGELQKGGKFSDTFADKIGMGILGGAGAAAGCLFSSPVFGARLGATAGKEVGKLLGGKVGRAHHEKNIAKLLKLVYYSQEEKTDFRRMLAAAAFDIFQSFEMQFMRVTAEFGTKHAMHQFARDATNRAVNYLKNNECASISEAVILGESKISNVLGVPIATSHIKSPGFDVSYKYQSDEVKWNTASLYQKVGLVVSEGETVNSFKKKDRTSRCDKYGYRRLLSKEVWDELKVKYVSDEEVKSGNRQFADYQYILSSYCSAEWSQSMLDLLNSKDQNLFEGRIKEMLGEVRNDILEELNVLKEQRLQLHEEDRKKLDIIVDSLKNLKTEEYSTNLLKHFQELARSVERGQKESRELLKQIAQIHREQQNRQQERGSIWFNVKDPVVLFTGRQEELEKLHDAVLRSGEGAIHSKITWIYGLGGIGKSELVRKYVGDHHKDKNVIWINAEKCETLAESFLELARDRLSIPTEYPNGKEKKIESIVKDIYRYLARKESLFVFDDATGNEDLNKFLPLYDLKPNKPYILITSRYQECEIGVQVVELKELKLEDALKFVRNGLSISKEDVSENEKILCLVEKLQCFPLAIQQAIAYINGQRAKKFSVSKYLEVYQVKARDLLAFKGFRGRLNSYEETTYTTWKITTDIISKDESDGELALKILYFMAYIEPENVQRKILLHLLGDDEEKVISAVQLLVRYSMITSCGQDRTQDILNIHTLVQEVMRLELRSRGKECEILRELLQLVKTDLKTEDFDHAVSVWEHADCYEEIVNDFSDVPTMIVCELDKSLKSQKACAFGINASLLLEETLGLDHLDTLSTLNGLAVVLSRLAIFDAALRIFLQVSRKMKSLLGINNPDTLTTMYHIASVHKNQGDYQKALKVYQEVLAGRKQAIGPDHPHTLLTMKGIADIFLYRDDCEEALKIYQEVLGKQEKCLDHDNPDIFTTMNAIASVLQKQGRYEEALEIYEKVLSKRKEIFGLEHPDTLTTVKGMAEICLHQENYEGALEYCKEIWSAKMPLGTSQHFIDALIISENVLNICNKNEKIKVAIDVLACNMKAFELKCKFLSARGLDKEAEIFLEGRTTDFRMYYEACKESLTLFRQYGCYA